MSRPYTLRLPQEIVQRINTIMERERARNQRSSRKPPTTSEILQMLIKIGIEHYFES